MTWTVERDPIGVLHPNPASVDTVAPRGVGDGVFVGHRRRWVSVASGLGGAVVVGYVALLVVSLVRFPVVAGARLPGVGAGGTQAVRATPDLGPGAVSITAPSIGPGLGRDHSGQAHPPTSPSGSATGATSAGSATGVPAPVGGGGYASGAGSSGGSASGGPAPSSATAQPQASPTTTAPGTTTTTTALPAAARFTSPPTTAANPSSTNSRRP